MENLTERKNEISKNFWDCLEQARQFIRDVSENNKIEFMDNGVTVVVIDCYSDDNDISEVDFIENGVIVLENGTEMKVSEVSNLTDLVTIIEAIDE
jgi:hypothetical protein